MKFNVKSNELLATLKIAIKGYDSTDETSFIHFGIEDTKLIISSRCMSGFFSGEVELTNLEIGEDDPRNYFVDGNTLKKLSGVFLNSPIPITFKINKNSRSFKLSYSGNNFTLPILSDTDEITPPEVSQLGVAPASEFMEVTNDLLKIVDNDKAAQENPSSCLHLTFSEDSIKTMGTDRFAIAEISKPFTGNPEIFEDEDSFTVLIKHPQAQLMSKAVTAGEMFTLLYSDEYFGYKDGDGNTVLVGRTDNNPLNIEPIKNLAGDEEFVTIETLSLREALSIVSKLATNNLHPITLILNKEDADLSLKSMTGDSLAIACEEWNIENDREIPFIRSVLQEALIPVSTDLVQLAWTDNGDSTFYQLFPFDGENREEGVFLGVMQYAG